MAGRALYCHRILCRLARGQVDRNDVITGRRSRVVLPLLVCVVAASLFSLPRMARGIESFDPDQPAIVEGAAIRWTPLLSAMAAESQVPRHILRSILIVESGGDPYAHLEPIDGFGLMHVTNAVARSSSVPQPADLFDPVTNVRITAQVLSVAHQRWGSWDMAVMHWYDVRRPDQQPFTSGYSWESESFKYLQGVRALYHDVPREFETADFRGAALLHGLTAVGMPYAWSGNSWEAGGFDCSGLAQWMYRYANRDLPAGSAAQWDATVRIEEHEARPGDLVFFSGTWEWGISHVGVYMGDGLMLHSPTEGKVVEVIPIYDSYWGAHLAGYGRVP